MHQCLKVTLTQEFAEQRGDAHVRFKTELWAFQRGGEGNHSEVEHNIHCFKIRERITNRTTIRGIYAQNLQARSLAISFKQVGGCSQKEVVNDGELPYLSRY